MKRETERSTTDSRYRAEIVLPTGKTVTLASDWKPYHWDEVDTLRRKLIAEARSRAEQIRGSYGLECTVIRVVREDRHTAHVIETTVTAKFHSEHYLEVEG
jgi:hypothetical protein